MGGVKLERNANKAQRQLLQAKLEDSIVEDVNLLCQWSSNEKNFVIEELLRYALGQESDFEHYKQGLASQSTVKHVESNLKPSARDTLNNNHL